MCISFIFSFYYSFLCGEQNCYIYFVVVLNNFLIKIRHIGNILQAIFRLSLNLSLVLEMMYTLFCLYFSLFLLSDFVIKYIAFLFLLDFVKFNYK